MRAWRARSRTPRTRGTSLRGPSSPRRRRPRDRSVPVSRVRRTLQWSAAGAATLVALWGFYRSSLRVAEAGPEIASSRRLLTLLTLAIVVLALGFVGVLIRNLVRLIVDRKRG